MIPNNTENAYILTTPAILLPGIYTLQKFADMCTRRYLENVHWNTFVIRKKKRKFQSSLVVHISNNKKNCVGIIITKFKIVIASKKGNK